MSRSFAAVVLASGVVGALLAALAGISLASESTAVFSCSCPGKQWNARVEFQETGKATLQFGKNGTKGSCALAFRDFALSPRAEVPSLQATLTHAACQLPSDLSEEILGRLYLKVTKSEGRKYSARLQWLRHGQPAGCKVTRLDSQAMKRLETRWKDGDLKAAGAEAEPPESKATHPRVAWHGCRYDHP